MAQSTPKHERQLVYFLFSTSMVTFTFLLRPFSSSFETFLLAVMIFSIVRAQHNKPIPLAFIGFVAAIGIFNRITFVAFAAASILHLLCRHSFADKKWRNPVQLCYSLSPLLVAFVLTSAGIILSDTSIHTAWPQSRSLVVVPLASMRYNSRVTNLEQHGLHPRFLHLLVNFPLLFGPMALALPEAFVAHSCRYTASVLDPLQSSASYRTRMEKV